LNSSQQKIVEDADQIADRVAALLHPVVFTNGCFEILHRGHVTYLEQASAMGNSLVVGINSDASVKDLNKGKGRPINPLADRMAVVAALTSVILVIPFDDDTPEILIKQVKPDILVKGGDWPVEKIVGNEFVLGYGGKVISIPFKFDRSTTDLIAHIRNQD